MKALLYDCPSGISGDMNLGALVDVGVPAEHLRGELARLRIGEEFELTLEKAEKLGIAGTRAKVQVPERHGHPHRRYRDIKKMIADSPFNPVVKDTAGRIFALLAEAEARIHRVALDNVTFHEVGATDSIVDVFGAAICLDYLGVETVLSMPVELGSGFVNCAHGRLPVPAPATLELMKDLPCLTGGVSGEATTPTGAAILKGTVRQFGPRFAITPRRVGYGVGQRDFAIPNVLRVVVGEVAKEGAWAVPQERTNVEITANIDDMSPESYEPLLERLFSAGASDVFLTPIMMKKSRPAHMISVLARQEKVETLVEVLFEESTTIGVRLHSVAKRMLPRSIELVPTSFGEVRVKIVQMGNGARRWKIEHEDVRRLAAESRLPYLAMRRELDAQVRERLEPRHALLPGKEQ